MSKKPRNFSSDPNRPSFLEELYQGRFRWDLIRDFPVQEAQDRAKGDRLVEQLTALLRERIDPTAVDRDRQLPEGFLAEMATRGYFRLQANREVGGHELSHYNTFRVVQAAASWCTPVALSIAIENALGASAFLSVVPEGPLRELLSAHVARGGLSASADSEPQGAANQRRATTATRVETADAYLLNGQKVFVGHAPVAELVSVSATIRENGQERVQMFFVRTDSPGVTAGQWHEYMGIKGFPNGWLNFDNVLVPASQMFVERASEHQVRVTPETAKMVARGRLHLIAAPSLAIAKLCVQWARDFVLRREIDGRKLADYQEIQLQLAESLAQTFAIEAMSQWCLLPDDQDRRLNQRFEQNAAKNVSSLLCWDVVERTMSLLAAEGYETAHSKQERGAPPVPVERFLRDARNLRISGGVDFQIDNWIARMSILSYYYPEPDHADELAKNEPVRRDFDGAVLSGRNLGHLRWVADEVHRFGATCLELARNNPDRASLMERERTLILLTSIARELLVMSLTLARASKMAATGDDSGQELADVYCVSAGHRIADLRRRLSADLPAHVSSLNASWLSGTSLEHLTSDAATGSRR
ncbi:acyl-CoA dehydrogenase family protein [Cystobacter fuscus]|uniref:acyl-CoA dehydrogenase family protein n=1 Tax=Cystobacter fuscus TaxID=43 RepID=UPI002B2D6EFB|nr:acyl-CoA dehydrogenase [Cystobacter fuscus]